MGRGEITQAEWLTARKRVEARLNANRAAFARLTQRDAVADYIGRGDELRAQWEGLNLSRLVAIVKAVLNEAAILPAQIPGAGLWTRTACCRTGGSRSFGLAQLPGGCRFPAGPQGR